MKRLPLHLAMYAFCVLVLASCASSCSSLGLETPKTFNERAAFARETVNGVVQATINALDSQSIHSSDAEWVRDSANRTLTLLTAAETAYGTGDVTTAEGRLALAEGVLRELQKYLATRGVES